jgi:hypothetical protein
MSLAGPEFDAFSFGVTPSASPHTRRITVTAGSVTSGEPVDMSSNTKISSVVSDAEQRCRSISGDMTNLTLRARKMTRVALQKALSDIVTQADEAERKYAATLKQLREAIRDIESIRELSANLYLNTQNALSAVHKEACDADEKLRQREATVSPAE